MTVNYRLPDGRDYDQVFATGNAGITTGYKTAAGGDLGNRYAGGNSGLVTKAKNAAGTDLGSLFAAGGSGSPLTPGSVPDTLTKFTLNCPITANLNFVNNGTITGDVVGGSTWALAGVTASNYELLWSLVSGTAPSTSPGAQNTALNMATTRSFSWTRAIPGDTAGTIQIIIRRVGSPAENITQPISYDVECDT